MDESPDNAAPAGPQWPQGVSFLIACACVVIIVAGLRAAKAFFVPLSVALFLSLFAIPVVRRLRRRGWREGLAVSSVIALVAAGTLLVPVVVGASMQRFIAAVGGYKTELTHRVEEAMGFLREHELVSTDFHVSDWFDPSTLLQLMADTTGGLLGVLSNLVVVLLTMAFMLSESQAFPAKLARAFGRPEVGATFEQIVDRVGGYFSVKAMTSLLTGVLVGTFVAIVGVGFPLLWGFVAFLFNFIPNIGSIIAAVPAVLLAWLDSGVGTAGVVVIGYLAINMVVGNVIEPRLLGARLGLSTAVVFVSLLFWSWVWGPVGMILSVPIMVVLEVVLEHSGEFRPVAVILGRDEPNEARER